jgi:hypothetical protein
VAGVQEPGAHAGRELRLGGEGDLLCPARGAAPVGIRGQCARNVEFPVHRRVPALTCVDQVDSNLRLDPVSGARALALNADRAAALLHFPVSSTTSTAWSSAR